MPGSAKDVLERRDRIGVDLHLLEARKDAERTPLAKRADHQDPVVLGSRLLVGIVVDRDLELGRVGALPVHQPAPVLVEERRVVPTLDEL
jgi:hypothetical protein